MKSDSMRDKPVALVAVLVVLFILSEAWFAYSNFQAGSVLWEVIVSAVILGIPLSLLYFCIGLLVLAWREKRLLGQVEPRRMQLIHRAARVASILIILFVSLFALDVFGMEGSIWEKLLGFLMHLLPSLIMAVVLALAWRWPAVGFFAFLLASIFFLRFFFVDPLMGFGNLLLFALPMAVIALLFLADWKWHAPALPGEHQASA